MTPSPAPAIIHDKICSSSTISNYPFLTGQLVMLNPALRLSPSLTRYELKIVKSFLLLPSGSPVPTVEPFEEFLLTVSSFGIFPDIHVYMCTYNENNISKFILPCVVIRETVWRSTFTSNRIEIRPSITRCFFSLARIIKKRK